MLHCKAIIAIVCFWIGCHALAIGQSPKYPDTLNRKRLYTAIGTEAGVWLGGMYFLQNVWYKDKARVPFEFYDDSKGYLQIDKCGHAYAAYFESYIGYHWLRHAGVSKRKAIWYGGTLGFILQTPIEVWDGMYEGWGFSWSDMAANALGPALIMSQAALFDEQLLRLKFSYRGSPYAEQSNGLLGDTPLQSFFYDYNGHTYWLSLGLNRVVKSKYLPDWLNIAAGYSANGMFGEFKNYSFYQGQAIPATTRYRQYLLSLDIDWQKIPTRSKWLKAVFNGLNFVKMPFPALEINSLGQFKAYALYY